MGRLDSIGYWGAPLDDFNVFQAFLMVDLSSSNFEPYMLFHFTLDPQSSNWIAVETQVLPPACVPEDLHGVGHAIVHEVLRYQQLLPAAIKAGFLVAVQKRNLFGETIQSWEPKGNLPLPTPPRNKALLRDY